MVGGKILASTALDRVDEWSTSRLNQGSVILYPPDPVKFFAGIAVRGVLTHREEGEEDGRAPHPIVKAISKLAYPTLASRASTVRKAHPRSIAPARPWHGVFRHWLSASGEDSGLVSSQSSKRCVTASTVVCPPDPVLHELDAEVLGCGRHFLQSLGIEQRRRFEIDRSERHQPGEVGRWNRAGREIDEVHRDILVRRALGYDPHVGREHAAVPLRADLGRHAELPRPHVPGAAHRHLIGHEQLDRLLAVLVPGHDVVADPVERGKGPLQIERIERVLRHAVCHQRELERADRVAAPACASPRVESDHPATRAA